MRAGRVGRARPATRGAPSRACRRADSRARQARLGKLSLGYYATPQEASDAINRQKLSLADPPKPV
eukprot:6085425-Prymnesium_polylepis.1